MAKPHYNMIACAEGTAAERRSFAESKTDQCKNVLRHCEAVSTQLCVLKSDFSDFGSEVIITQEKGTSRCPFAIFLMYLHAGEVML